MTLSLAKAGDHDLLKHVQALKAAGADLVIVTTETANGPDRIITRVVTATWNTHNTEASVL